MAFLTRAERKLHNLDDSTLGPGSYLSQHSYSTASNFAPFSSTSKRELIQYMNHNHTPGPGSYSFSHSAPEVSLNHWGNPKFSASFASQNTRFPSSTALNPGPGSYSQLNLWTLRKRSKKSYSLLSKSSKPDRKSVPSIPTHNQSFGYNEINPGELIMQKNPKSIYSGELFNSVGPGDYDPKAITKRRGPILYKSKGSREIFKPPVTDSLVGPGSYSESKLHTGPIYKLKRNAVFLSKLEKSLKIVADIEVPGPGSYNPEKHLDCGVTKKLPIRLQNFGSTCGRFQSKINNSHLGPGEYMISDEKAFGKTQSKAAFTSGDARFNYKCNLVPGPGQYDADRFVLSRGGDWKFEAFGSSGCRFPLKQGLEEMPGPGQYSSENHKKFRESGVAFMSQEKRIGVSVKSEVPAPGQYEISSKIGRKVPPVVKKSIITPGNKKNMIKHSSERFFIQKTENEMTPGPGSYELSENNKKYKLMIAKEKRFKIEQVNETPGPGAYIEYGRDFIRKSFNSLYHENPKRIEF